MYQVNSPRVVHETLDGETIIIDTQTGFYYTIASHASVIWSALVAGQRPQQIKDQYAAAGLIAPSAIHQFIEDLADAALIVAATTDTSTSAFSIPSITDIAAPHLQLKRHADLQELIEMDPIHEVDVALGWPTQSKDNS